MKVRLKTIHTRKNVETTPKPLCDCRMGRRIADIFCPLKKVCTQYNTRYNRCYSIELCDIEDESVKTSLITAAGPGRRHGGFKRIALAGPNGEIIIPNMRNGL